MPMATPELQREYQRNWVAKRRAEFFKDKACVKCRGLVNLELDHIDPLLKINHAIWSWTESRRLEEIAKCQVLCYDCHLAKTLEQRAPAGSRRKHGTASMYKFGCRCEDCRSVYAIIRKRYKGRVRSSGGQQDLKSCASERTSGGCSTHLPSSS